MSRARVMVVQVERERVPKRLVAADNFFEQALLHFPR